MLFFKEDYKRLDVDIQGKPVEKAYSNIGIQEEQNIVKP